MPKRKLKRVVKIGNIAIGGNHPIAVQTMLNVPVKDIAGNVAQAKRVAEAGCQIVRVTVPAPEDAAVVAAIKEAVNGGNNDLNYGLGAAFSLLVIVAAVVLAPLV